MNEKQINEDRKKHLDRRSNEPILDWEWMRFFPTTTNEEMQKIHDPRYEIELRAEKETDRDLTKSIQQLVCDFNFEVEKAHSMTFPLVDTLMLEAQRRMVAMMARVAIKHEDVSVRTMTLTDRITKLTYVLIGIGVLSIILSFIALSRN